jgi:hypothetical protein
VRRRELTGLGALFVSACTTYGKVQNPAPAQDLRAPLRIESVLRSTHTFDGTPALQVRIWIRAPKGAVLVLADTGIELSTGREPSGLVTRADLQAGDGRQVREVRVSAGREAPATAFLPLRGDRLHPGAEFKLRLAWGLENLARAGATSPGVSRTYEIRVQRTNYGIALGISWLLVGTTVAVVRAD